MAALQTFVSLSNLFLNGFRNLAYDLTTPVDLGILAEFCDSCVSAIQEVWPEYQDPVFLLTGVQSFHDLAPIHFIGGSLAALLIFKFIKFIWDIMPAI